MISFRLIADESDEDGQRRYMGFTREFEILWVLDPKEAIVFTEERAEQALRDAVKMDKRHKSFFLVPAIVMMAGGSR